jgi:hypothetical protein
VDISDPFLARVLSTLNQKLARSCQRPLSISIAHLPRNGECALDILEPVAIRSVLKLLKADFGRIRTLIVHTKLRSSLREVVELVQGKDYGRLENFEMYFDFDDLTGSAI